MFRKYERTPLCEHLYEHLYEHLCEHHGPHCLIRGVREGVLENVFVKVFGKVCSLACAEPYMCAVRRKYFWTAFQSSFQTYTCKRPTRVINKKPKNRKSNK